VNLVWPRNGDTPKVRFLANITSPDDLFVRKHWLGLADMLAGREVRRFGVPFDVCLADDLLLITDPGEGCVHFIDLAGYRYRAVREAGPIALEQPIGVAADAAGRVYVSDSSLGNVFVFDREGRFLSALAGRGVLQRPADMAWHEATQRLYVVDVLAHEIQVFATDGRLVQSIGGRGVEPGKLNYPTHVWVEADGTLLVTSAMDYAVAVFDSAGKYVASFGQKGDTPGYFSRPKGVATDPAGHIYVVDAIFDKVQIFDRRARLLLAVGESGGGPGELWLPAGIYVDARQRIFIADQQNHRIAVFEYIGE
jgi:DNA-binding beta-propeller fold protein YncE